jgi:hypothetical protein
VFPVGADKRPLTEHGLHDATQNEEQINAWWERWPDANVALDLPTDIAVIDIDPRNGATYTPEDFDLTRTVRTPSGGWHLYFKVPADVQLRGQAAVGVDVKRGGKGYVLAPPSVNLDGVAYELINSAAIVDLPDAILTRIRKDAPAPVVGVEGFSYNAYGQRALENECGRMALAREGERNHQLNKSAFAIGQLVAGGALEESTALTELALAAERAGLDQEEIDRTIRSGFDSGLREPRSAPEHSVAAASAGDPSSPFAPVDPSSVRPPRALLQAPFLYENALTWLWGPSGHGKSLALDKAIADLSRHEVHACLWDWEDTSMEVERLARLGANFEHAHVFAPREGDDIFDFASDGFVDRVVATVEHYDAKLVVFNPFTLLVPPAARDSADAWNTPVKAVVNACRKIMALTGAAVVVTDHQENVEAEHAQGGRSKKALADLYIRVTRAGADYVPGRPYHFHMLNLKQAREYLPPMTAEVTGDHQQGALRVKWGGQFETPQAQPMAPVGTFAERLAAVRAERPAS